MSLNRFDFSRLIFVQQFSRSRCCSNFTLHSLDRAISCHLFKPSSFLRHVLPFGCHCKTYWSVNRCNGSSSFLWFNSLQTLKIF